MAEPAIAGPPGPVTIAGCAATFGLPAWAALWWLARNGRRRGGRGAGAAVTGVDEA